MDKLERRETGTLKDDKNEDKDKVSSPDPDSSAHSSCLSSSSCHSDHAELATNVFQLDLCEPDERYLEKLNYLNVNCDEQDLKNYSKKMRCVSSCQSYNIMCNPDFYQLDEALSIAKIYATNPWIEL
jgi:hypothetical protein